MKKTIMLIVAAVGLFGTNCLAQDRQGDGFVLWNSTFDVNRGNNFQNQNFHPDRTLSIQYIKSINKLQAYRFGLGLREYNSQNTLLIGRSADTNIQRTTYQNSNMPHIMIGKEWRKILHPDIMIVGGVDFMLGAGPNERSIVEDRSTSSFSNRVLVSNQNNGWAMFGAAAPFTGIRICWRSLALGYGFSIPISGTYINANASLFEYDMSIKQTLSLGLRVGNKKAIKQ